MRPSKSLLQLNNFTPTSISTQPTVCRSRAGPDVSHWHQAHKYKHHHTLFRSPGSTPKFYILKYDECPPWTISILLNGLHTCNKHLCICSSIQLNRFPTLTVYKSRKNSYTDKDHRLSPMAFVHPFSYSLNVYPVFSLVFSTI